MCELPSFISESRPRARVAHKCCECRQEIAPGDVYEKAAGAWDGELCTFKTCLWCVGWRGVALALSDRLWGEMCIEYGGVADVLREASSWTSPLYWEPREPQAWLAGKR